jgi:hypothetical protein
VLISASGNCIIVHPSPFAPTVPNPYSTVPVSVPSGRVRWRLALAALTMSSTLGRVPSASMFLDIPTPAPSNSPPSIFWGPRTRSPTVTSQDVRVFRHFVSCRYSKKEGSSDDLVVFLEWICDLKVSTKNAYGYCIY